ncbi:hypothetical protein [Brevibacillus sp. SAFN-007a]|uniref:hypothetical protein n=1 Tax=Brevibacillus sp. SAFN-007a TaxID=3436862 RepID=UPI003F8096C4
MSKSTSRRHHLLACHMAVACLFGQRRRERAGFLAASDMKKEAIPSSSSLGGG